MGEGTGDPLPTEGLTVPTCHSPLIFARIVWKLEKKGVLYVMYVPYVLSVIINENTKASGC